MTQTAEEEQALREQRQADYDAMPVEWRELVADYGFAAVVNRLVKYSGHYDSVRRCLVEERGQPLRVRRKARI